jgi:hypothetical protein
MTCSSLKCAPVLAIAALALGVPMSASAHTTSVARSLPAVASSTTVPALSGKRLDVAEMMLGQRGLRWREVGGGMFGILVKSNWVVCMTMPGRGARVGSYARVSLVVDRPGNC